MRIRKGSLSWIAPLILVSSALVLLTWGNTIFTRANPGGNDFLVHWMGARMFLTEGVSPYSDETALEIQKFAYGRPAQADEHELRVAYPFYSIRAFLPFSLIPDFALARALWMTLLEAGLIALSFVSLRLVEWRPPLWTMACFLGFSVLWYHGARPLINGNIVILIGLGFAGVLLSLRYRADELAGVLMALTTIKPQLAFLLSVYLVFIAIAQKRWKFIFWFFGTILLLTLASMLLLPDWILQNIREIFRYPGYNPPGTLQAALKGWFPGFGSRLGWGITGVLAFLLLAEWSFSRRSGFRGMLWTACLTLTAGQWIGIQSDPGNFIILMPALVLIFSTLAKRWRRTGVILSVGMMAALLIGLWFLFLATVEYGYQPQQSPIMFLPLPGLLIVGLYWVRWWVIRPTHSLHTDLPNPEMLL
ncbi:MAG: DUF2029 domain-containing protein [Anaerolineaceae bacterium]|nr:DUF2029 domain-containing protein [Anaerolineaceae bacterium]